MLIVSPSFQDDAAIPRKFTCDGGNMNPELQIEHVTPDAKSLALIVHDPDASMLGGFTHWVVWNIDPSTTLIKEESVPPGATEGFHTGGDTGYTGPCPPSGVHRYEFHLYALDRLIYIPATSAKDDLEAAMEGHILEEATLTGKYQRESTG